MKLLSGESNPTRRMSLKDSVNDVQSWLSGDPEGGEKTVRDKQEKIEEKRECMQR